MNNNFDVWSLVIRSLCRQYILNKLKNVASCLSMHNIEVSSYDTRLVIYEDNVEADEGYGRSEYSWLNS